MDEKKKYSEKDLEGLMKQATDKGAVLCLLYFDAHGKDKASVENSLIDFVARLSKEKGLIYCKGEILPALERTSEKSKEYSTSVEVRVLSTNFDALNRIALKYAPISLEILSPDKITLDLSEAMNVLTDSSNTTQSFASYILEKTMTKEEIDDHQERLKRKIENAAKLREINQSKKEGIE